MIGPLEVSNDGFKASDSSNNSSDERTVSSSDKFTKIPTVARFVTSGNAPRFIDSLMLSELVHLALVELSNGSSVFTGCDASKRPLQGHVHAYILPESCPDAAGTVTHITVYAPSGFGRVEVDSLKRLEEVRGGGMAVALKLQVIGAVEELCGSYEADGFSSLFKESKVWVSRTPFISTRHPKTTRAGVPKLDSTGIQIGSPKHDLIRLLKLAGFPEPVAVEDQAFTRIGGVDVPWKSFACWRGSGGGRRASHGMGCGFRVEFPRPVRGPVMVGYAAHFGMGGFLGIL